MKKTILSHAHNYALFAVTAKTDDEAWEAIAEYYEVEKFVCSIGDMHLFICFSDPSVGDNIFNDIGDNIKLLKDSVNSYTTY